MFLHLYIFTSGCRHQTGHKLSWNHWTLLTVDHLVHLLSVAVDLVLDFVFMLQLMAWRTWCENGSFCQARTYIVIALIIAILGSFITTKEEVQRHTTLVTGWKHPMWWWQLTLCHSCTFVNHRYLAECWRNAPSTFLPKLFGWHHREDSREGNSEVSMG